jgi:hypothetical protein
VFLKFTSKDQLGRVKFVTLYNLPFEDNSYINNIKNTITCAFMGLSFISQINEPNVLDKIVKHNLIDKIYRYTLDFFTGEDLIPVLNLFTRLLNMGSNKVAEVSDII